jgi:hypothetical protein
LGRSSAACAGSRRARARRAGRDSMRRG